MSHSLKLLLAGLLPLLAGYACNYLFLYLPVSGALLLLLSFALLLLWGYLAYRLSAPDRNFLLQAGLLCAFGLVMLALVLYQELILVQYWAGALGFGTQMYFLPFLSAVSTVFSPLLSVFMPAVSLWALYPVEWLVLLLVSALGCLLKKRRRA